MFAMKHCCKDITKAITPMKLGNVNFTGYTHVVDWFENCIEDEWARQMKLKHFKMKDWLMSR